MTKKNEQEPEPELQSACTETNGETNKNGKQLDSMRLTTHYSQHTWLQLFSWLCGKRKILGFDRLRLSKVMRETRKQNQVAHPRAERCRCAWVA